MSDQIFWLLLGSFAALLTTFAFVPQVIKMWRTRSVQDVSPVTLVQFILGISIWAVYGIHLGDPVIIASNVVGLTILLVALGSYFRLRRPGPTQPAQLQHHPPPPPPPPQHSN